LLENQNFVLRRFGEAVRPESYRGLAERVRRQRATKAGAVGFLTKPFRDQDLLDAVQIALERDRSRRTQDETIHGVKANYESLTPREQEVISFVTAGLMNKQIAAKLDVSEVTVKFHRSNVMKKMGAHSLAELVRMADMLGIRLATQ
jgi:FixJ family two-component response regulator